MLKKNGFGKRMRQIRKPDIAVLSLASLTVILLFAWGGLYWQERSADAAAAQGNDDIELPVIMLDLDAIKEPQPQGSDPDKGNEPAAGLETGSGGQEPGKLLEDLAQSPGGLLGIEDGWPNLTNPSQGTDSNGQGASVAAPGKGTTGGGKDGDAAQIHDDPSPKPTQEIGPGAVVTSKPSPTPTPATSNQPSVTPSPSSAPSPSPSATPIPDGSGNDLVQQYELELLTLQAGCIMEVKSVLKEAETQAGKADSSDIEALQRIGAEAAISLEAAGAACETKFNKAAAKAGQDGVSAEQIAEWRQTYNEVMEQLRAEAELKLQQLLRI